MSKTDIKPKGKVSSPEPSKRRGLGDKIYCRVGIVEYKRNTGKATLIQLKAGQVINNFKISKGTEIWIPNTLWTAGIFLPLDKHIWIEEDFYNKLRFVN